MTKIKKMIKIDKNILAQFFSLIFLFGIMVVPVYAAKQVQGEVPAYVPLQQAPIGVSPNVNNNVQFSDPAHQGQFDASGTLQTGADANLDGKNSDSHPDIIFASGNPSQTGGSKLWFIAGIIFILAIIAIFIKRNSKE